MGSSGDYNLITLLPGQVVDRDPDGLLKAEAKILRELMKPHTINLTKLRETKQ